MDKVIDATLIFKWQDTVLNVPTLADGKTYRDVCTSDDWNDIGVVDRCKSIAMAWLF